MKTGLNWCVLRSVTNQRSCWLTPCDSKIFSVYVDRIKEDKKTLRTIKRRKAKLVCHILRRNYLVERIIEGNRGVLISP